MNYFENVSREIMVDKKYYAGVFTFFNGDRDNNLKTDFMRYFLLIKFS